MSDSARQSEEDGAESLQDVFTLNFTQKVVNALNSIFPAKTERSIFLSRSWRPYFFNRKLVAEWERQRLRISFIEDYALEGHLFDSSEVVLLSHAAPKELRHSLEFADKFVACHQKASFHIHLLLVPRKGYLTKLLLESWPGAELHSRLLRVVDINFDFVALEEDLLSLEYETSLEDLLVRPSYDLHDLCAEALCKLQLLFGTFKDIACHGPEAEGVKKVFDKISNEQHVLPPPSSGLWEDVLLFDRTTDLITPQVTQYTYLGMLDDLLGIRLNSLEVPASEGQRPEECYLYRERDPFFALFKDYNNPTLMKQIKERIRGLLEIKRENISIDQAEKSIAQIKNKQALEFHLGLATRIDRNFKLPLTIELNRLQYDVLQGTEKWPVDRFIELIQVGLQPLDLIRLLIFLNIVLGGFPSLKFEIITKEILEVHGASLVRALGLLERAGLFINRDDPTSNLELIRRAEGSKQSFYSAGRSETNHFAGYVPPGCVFITRLLSGKIPSLAAPMSGPTHGVAFGTRGIIVFFIGGISYAEVATLRQSIDPSKKLLICSCSIINAASVARCFLQG